MARERDRRFDLEDLVARPGTYFNPQTEVLLVVDDSTSIDSEIFNMEEFEGADWVLVSDDVPVDESSRDEILENYEEEEGTDEDEEDEYGDEENGYDDEDE